MMRIKDKFNYVEDPDWQTLGLPYKNGEVYMYFFLPKERFGLGKQLKVLDGQRIMEMIGDCDNLEVEVIRDNLCSLSSYSSFCKAQVLVICIFFREEMLSIKFLK